MTRVVQKEGQFVVVFPQVISSNISTYRGENAVLSHLVVVYSTPSSDLFRVSLQVR